MAIPFVTNAVVTPGPAKLREVTPPPTLTVDVLLELEVDIPTLRYHLIVQVQLCHHQELRYLMQDQEQ